MITSAAPPSTPRQGISLLVVLALLGFLLVVLSQSTTTARRAEEPRRERLARLILDRRERVVALDRDVRRLRTQVAGARRESARLSVAATLQSAQRTRLADEAGVSAVNGPGIEVRLQDSGRTPVDPEDSGAYRIHDVDLQLVVNALLAAGAEAVAVNGNRLVATSPIRAAGDTIVVGFRPLSPPYVVTAVGADRARFDGSEIARRFERWRSLFGLGFRVRQDRQLRVPAYSGRLETRAAAPETGGA